MTATLLAAVPTVGEVRRAQHEEPTYGIAVAGPTMGERRIVGGDDLSTPGMVEGETIRMRLAQVSSGPLLAGHGRIL